MGNELEGRQGPGQEEATMAGFQACDGDGLNQGNSKNSWERQVSGTSWLTVPAVCEGRSLGDAQGPG